MKYQILHFVPGFDHGGIESRLLDWYHTIDRNKFQLDLLKLTSDDDNTLIKEFKSLGGNVYTLPKFNLRNYIKFKLELRSFFRNYKYDVVHCHSPITGKFVLEEARNNSVPTRILHSRTVKIDNNSTYKFYRNYLKRKAVAYANNHFACSEEAGEWMFGSDNTYKIINNGIRSENFIYTPDRRAGMRKELNLEDSIVIGNVGRFTTSKNHSFLIDLLLEISNRGYENCTLLFLGEGPTQAEIIEKVNKEGLSDKVFFIGKKDNVEDYYQAMDVFVFPSEFEGFGTVAIEAQAAGLKTIVSTGVPQTVEVTNLVERLPLEAGISVWADKLIESFEYTRTNKQLDLINSGFDVSTTVHELERLYSNSQRSVEGF